jgi:Uma2 family endonuclease
MSQASSRQRGPRRWLLLKNVNWLTYTRLLRTFADRPSLRLTYDRGILEIMTPLFEHESFGQLLGRFIVVLTEELGLPIAGGGCTTFRRRRLRRGLEPDNCFWIAHEAQVRGRLRIDLRVDPPPDLCLEIDITRSSLNRMSIYSALRVPEVWRYDGATLTFEVLQPNGSYALSASSHAFPIVTPSDLLRFLALRGTADENAIVQQVREWVRQQRTPPTP